MSKGVQVVVTNLDSGHAVTHVLQDDEHVIVRGSKVDLIVHEELPWGRGWRIIVRNRP